MDSNYLFNIFIFLAAACFVVPIASRFRLGSVLGYLLAGVLIGPYGIGIIHNPEQIMHFGEFGVIMMLFMIGLELEPAMLWKMRRMIVGLGGLQVLLTTIVFTGIGILYGFSWKISLACGMALALSSTALVIQMLEEKGLLKTSAGESAFAVLLLQDIAVIPILIIMPLLASTRNAAAVVHKNILSDFPAWLHAIIIAALIAGIVVGGRYLSRYLFRFIARSNLREVFTATSLALVVGITLLMQLVGLSPALGAFLAGVVLANSEYRHTLESDIQPFKGLLLGLFFISVGMGMNFILFKQHASCLFAVIIGLIAVKALILLVLGRFFGLRDGQNILFAASLAQGGEFAFVLFQYANNLSILSDEHTAFLTLAVALSIAVTPFIMMINDKWIIPRFMTVLQNRNYDKMESKNSSVIIAGYGRFGQIVGRFLTAQGIKITILEKDPDQVEQLRKFNIKGYFGDASRLDLLQNAGAAKAKLLIVAVDDTDKCLEIVKLAKRHFPKLKVFARARNRQHAYELHKAGVDYFRRETFDSALHVGQAAMQALGANPADMRYRAKQFRQYDEKMLRRSFDFFEREVELINFSKLSAQELEHIMQEDIKRDK